MNNNEKNIQLDFESVFGDDIIDIPDSNNNECKNEPHKSKASLSAKSAKAVKEKHSDTDNTTNCTPQHDDNPISDDSKSTTDSADANYATKNNEDTKEPKATLLNDSFDLKEDFINNMKSFNDEQNKESSLSSYESKNSEAKKTAQPYKNSKPESRYKTSIELAEKNRIKNALKEPATNSNKIPSSNDSELENISIFKRLFEQKNNSHTIDLSYPNTNPEASADHTNTDSSQQAKVDDEITVVCNKINGNKIKNISKTHPEQEDINIHNSIVSQQNKINPGEIANNKTEDTTNASASPPPTLGKINLKINQPRILLETPYSVTTKTGKHMRYRLEYDYPDKDIPYEHVTTKNSESPINMNGIPSSEELIKMQSERKKGIDKKKNLTREILDWIKVFAIALVIAVFIRTFVFVIVEVDGSSMAPTLESHQKLIVTRFDYIFSNPSVQDIIICHYPDNPDDINNDITKNYVKRVIGTPGDTIEIKSGTVYVNGTPLEEDYIKYHDIEDISAFIVPENQYFVMGDNRANSKDSRIVGFIDKSLIIGKVRLIIYPFDEIKSVI